ncbi:hypothetical protein DCAR_0518880 [Daucus carota subsp. sativus]|uniref:Uncharacterized protein n=1 Tax=Daucus carota subsp. sativus TaxID=79200 RepID=A0A164XJV6_DAUCS|nr:hypothetical protein DCAR_0518880 [Daucus carota subsp. sativus]
MAAQQQTQFQFYDNDRNDSGIRAEKEKPQRADALNFLSSIKDGFGSGSQEYKYFVDLLIEYKQQRITIPVVVARAKLLFLDRQEFIEGFNKFLPAGYEISLPLSRGSHISYEKARNFVSKVQAAFSQDEERYVSFRQMIVGFLQEGKMSVLELSAKVCEFLEDRQDLLAELFDFICP